MPLEGLKWLKIEEECFRKALPMDFRLSPRRHRYRISALSAAV
jgi:hypothetical protein